jgi:geranylgeranyl diphosphate synthase, type I
VQELVDGQVADLDFERRTDVGIPECLGMAEGKTGALLGASCALGAAAAGSSAPQVRELDRFGRDLGLAFQLVDDLLGIWGAPEVTGKPVLSDLRSRKKSLPVVAALTAGTAASARLAELLFRPEPLTEDDLRLAARLIEEAGGRGWAEEEAERRLVKATDRLKSAEMPDAVREEFLGLTQFVTARDR